MSEYLSKNFVFSADGDDITLESGNNESTTSIDLHPSSSSGDAAIARIFTHAGNFAVDLTQRGYDAEEVFSVLSELMEILDECIPNNDPKNYRLNPAAITEFMELLHSCKD